MNYRAFAYKNLIFNSPLSEERAADLINLCSPASKILDIGCGWGELLLRALTTNPNARGFGIDNDPALIERARQNASDRNLSNRVEFICDDAKTIIGTFDLIIALGVTHIWGSDAEALGAIQQRLAPGGKLLYGSGIWMKPPSAEIKEIFGALPTFDELQNSILHEDLEIIYADPASIEEWDAFESSWRRGLEESGDAELIAFAAERKREYEEGYRNVLGFAYLCLQNNDGYRSN